MANFKFMWVLALSSFLVACGGSSSSSSSSSNSSSSEAAVSSVAASSSQEASSSHAVSSSAGAADSEGWTVYNGNHHPMAAGSVLLADAETLAQFEANNDVPTGADFFTVNGNGTVTFDSTANGADRLYARLDNVVSDGYPKHFTLLAGITGNSDDVRVLEIEMAFADGGSSGSRLKAIMRADGSSQGVQLERADNDESVDAYGLDMSGFRVYQFAVEMLSATHANVAVYIDGNDSPLISVNNIAMRPTMADGDNYVRIGDGGSHPYKGELDWVVWTELGAYSPSEVAGQLPANIGCVIGYGDSDDYVDCANPPVSTSSSADSSSSAGSSSSAANDDTVAPGIPEGDRTFFIAPGGSNTAAGTESAPFATLNRAVSIAQPGDVFVMRGGTYHHGVRIDINTNGTADKPIYVVNYPGEIPVFNFQAQEEAAGRDGIRLNANYWRLMGLHLTRAGGNGFRIHGSHNIIERCVAFENRLTGIHLEDGSHNLIKNNDSYRNFNMRNRVGNMADGFAAKYEALGPGNVFYGNRAWENSDDGFDFWMASSVITLENNWAFGNGNGAVFGNPEGFDGGGNGFKLGGNGIAGNHIIKRNMAFDNFGVSGNAKGFDHNNNSGALTLIHNTAFNNGRNYTFPNNPSSGQTVFQNNLSLAPGNVQVPSGSLQQGNSWQSTTPTASMFLSVNTALAKSPRKADGSLPDINLLRPKPDSYLVNGGVNIGEPFNGSAPDIGAFEYTP